MLHPAAANSVSAVLIAFSLATATPNQAQSQPQNKAAPAPTYEYEAATIKPSKGPGPDHKIGMWAASDGFNAWFVTPQQMISTAYGVQAFRVLRRPELAPPRKIRH